MALRPRLSLPNAISPRRYSSRSVRPGSTRVARITGTAAAANPTAPLVASSRIAEADAFAGAVRRELCPLRLQGPLEPLPREPQPAPAPHLARRGAEEMVERAQQ